MMIVTMTNLPKMPIVLPTIVPVIRPDDCDALKLSGSENGSEIQICERMTEWT
jgi:hypothetical protein